MLKMNTATERQASVCGKQAASHLTSRNTKRNTFTCILFLSAAAARTNRTFEHLASVFNIYVVFVCTYSAPRKRFNGLLMSFPGKYTEWRVCTAPNHRPQFGTPFDRRRFGKYVSFLLLRHLISRWHHILFALYSLATTHSFIDAIRPIEHSPFATCARVPFVSRSCIDISCGYIIIGQL